MTEWVIARTCAPISTATGQPLASKLTDMLRALELRRVDPEPLLAIRLNRPILLIKSVSERAAFRQLKYCEISA